MIVNDIDIDSNTPDSWDCQSSSYLYPSAGHVITDNLIVITDARVRNIISKCPKYRFPSKIVSEYDQKIPQSQTADNPVAPRGRAAQPLRDTRNTK